MTAPRLLTPNQIIIRGGTYIVIESLAGATLTCGSQSYTLGSGETVHAFEVTAGTYACTANKTGYYEASENVTITSGFEYITLLPTYLPSSYQQVEYLQSDGGQYITTSIEPAPSQVINIKFMSTNLNSVNRVFCARNSSYAPTAFAIVSRTQYQAKNNSGASATSFANPKFTEYNVYDVTFNASTTLTVNGTDYSNALQYGDTIVTTGAYFTIYRESPTNTQGLIGDIYKFTITQNGSKIIDLVPCYRKSDSVLGMYDKVTDTLFTNSGSGSFTAGANVQ